MISVASSSTFDWVVGVLNLVNTSPVAIETSSVEFDTHRAVGQEAANKIV
jgi:hypothetical protein